MIALILLISTVVLINILFILAFKPFAKYDPTERNGVI